MNYSRFFLLIRFTSCIFLFGGELLAQDVEVPQLKSVSYDFDSGKLLINWDIENPNLVDGYIVKRLIVDGVGVVRNTYNTIAIIDNPNVTEYLDVSTEYGTTAKPSERQEFYRIAAYRIIDNVQKLSLMSDVHSSILPQLIMEKCEARFLLNWTKYLGEELESYHIYMKEIDAQEYDFIADKDKNDTIFYFSEIEQNKMYRFYVSVGLKNGEIANSPIVTETAVLEKVPDTLNADYATVFDNQFVKLNFTINSTEDVDYQVLYKQNLETGYFDSIYSFSPGKTRIEYIDTVDVFHNYLYKVGVKSKCGNILGETNLCSNVVLNAKQVSKTKNNLIWNNYKQWKGGNSFIKIYRKIDDFDYELIDSILPYNEEFIDDFSDIVDDDMVSNGKFCYYVLSSEDDTNPYDIKGFSVSNEYCIEIQPIVYLPNALYPNSLFDENKYFKPKIEFCRDYLLIIYSRWGNKIFETNNPELAWSGYDKNGMLLAKGAYTYYLRFSNKNGKRVEKTGIVNLVY